MNHSCFPNIEHTWDDTTQRLILKSIRDVNAFGEMYICYGGTPEDSGTEVRREHLEKNFGFRCMCEVCCADDDLKRLQFYD